MIDRNRALTSEDLIRRYDLESLKINRKAIQMNKQGLDQTEGILNQFILSVLKGISNTEDQVDGKVTTWFYDYAPTDSNIPASSWETDATKNSHLGDLFYDQDTGYVYMFDIINEVYQWVQQTDDSIVQAMALANGCPDASDGYRDLFILEPTTPYKVGDIWFKEDGEIYRCNVARASGDFNPAEWIPSTQYSNDNYENDAKAILNQFKETITSNYICKVLVKTTRDSIELSVSSTTSLITEAVETLNAEINATNVALNESENKLLSEINGKLSASDIVELEKSVQNLITDTSYAINIAEDLRVNGTSRVQTETGYTFDKDGLTIAKTDANTKSILDETGLEVQDNTGSSSSTQFFAGVVDSDLVSRNSNLSDYEGKAVTYTNDIIVNNYLQMGNGRWENVSNNTYGNGIGFFPN